MVFACSGFPRIKPLSRKPAQYCSHDPLVLRVLLYIKRSNEACPPVLIELCPRHEDPHKREGTLIPVFSHIQHGTLLSNGITTLHALLM
jgi:hypothetical protein